MDFYTVVLFIPACFALNLTFGPNNLLAVTNGARHGLVPAMVAGTGRLFAFAPMIAVTAAGLGLLLATSAIGFEIVKWIGAIYLIWLGIQILRSAPLEIRNNVDAPSGAGAPNADWDARTLMRQDFITAAANPKAIVIITAFFPQFVPQDAYWEGFLAFGMVFLVFEWVAVVCYATVGVLLAKSANAVVIRWFNRASGATMIAFGGLLAMTQRNA